MTKKFIIIMVITGMFATACATDDPDKRAKRGAAIGAIAGAVIGHQVGGKKGRLMGAMAGAIAGASIGGYMDKQQKEFEQALAEEQRRKDIEISRLKDNSLKININSEVSFDFDSDRLKTAFIPSLNKVTDILIRFPKTVVHVIGHTDSVGKASYNQRLSERRAGSVSDYFAKKGITPKRLVAVGRGETQPRSDNRSEAGRQLNRRVELIIKPIREGNEQEAYRTPART